MLKLYYSFSKKFFDADKYENLEMDTEFLYLALSRKNMEDVNLLEKCEQWNAMRSRGCTDIFTAKVTDIFSPGMCCNRHKKHDKREPRLFTKEFKKKIMLC